MQAVVLIFIGIIIGFYISREMHEIDEAEMLRSYLVCIYVYGLLYAMKSNDVNMIDVCRERLTELGLDEETLSDPDKLEKYVDDCIKMTER